MCPAEKKGLPLLTMDEVAKHNTAEDCWIILGNDFNGGRKVYDATSYLNEHPGGGDIVVNLAGKNADEFFEDAGHSKEARDMLEEFLLGDLVLTAQELRDLQIEEKRKAGALQDKAIFRSAYAFAFFLFAFGIIKAMGTE